MSEKRVSKRGKILMTLLLLPAAIIVPALSLESHYATSTQAQNQPTTEQQQRITNYRAALGREIRENEQNQIRLRCGVAQANAKTLSTRLARVRDARFAAYDKILKDLNALLGRLENQAYETTALQENINTLQGKVDSFKTNMTNYYNAVNDMATMDCNADPVGFIAAVEAARKAHALVLPEITDIRTYVTNTIKPTLAQVREQIESGRTVGGGQ